MTGRKPRTGKAAGRKQGLHWAVAAIGLGLAVPALASAFRGPRQEFWARMTGAGALLGGFALLFGGAGRTPRLRLRDVALGLASASGLYATFKLGDRLTRRYLPGGDRQIREIYSLRELEPAPVTAFRLIAVIAPAEELFWRGLIQNALARRFGRWRGAAVATLAYTAAHVPSGNLTLIGAAGVAGAQWSALRAAGVPMNALIVSHCAWDVWIFLIQPTGEVTRLEPETAAAWATA